MRLVLATLFVLCWPAFGIPQQASFPRVEISQRLPHLGLQVQEVREVQADGSVTRRSSLASGQVVDLDELRSADHATGRAARGRLAPRLAATLADLPRGERLEAGFWLLEPDDGRDLGAELRERVAGVPRSEVAQAVRAARREILDASIARLLPRNADFAQAAAAAGAEIVLVAEAWPLVILRAPAPVLVALALHPLVDEVDQSQPAWFPEGNLAQGTMRTPKAWEQGGLANGSVKVLVNDTEQVQTNNPYLPTIVTLNSFSTGSHATNVAGNIANDHPLYRAAAYTLPQLYSGAGSGDSSAPPIWQAAIAAGVDFGNCSWWNGLKGDIEMLDRFFDYTIRTFGVMLFKSNGNQGDTTTPYATTPGNGFNMLCSGAFTDNNTPSWSGDAMASSSSYWNPVEGHEKPEVASPGTCVTTTGIGVTGIFECFSGTSSASPLTCGVAALLASADNTLLAQMTTVKAVLMASAWQNVEGNATLSEKDGAGGVHAAAAWALVRDQQWWYDGSVTPGDFTSNVLDVPMPLLAGDETRVVALWFGRANSAFTTDVLDMDLDLTVLAPGGGVVASSLHAFNPFEIASFVPQQTGTYTVRLTKMRFDGSSEPLTVAWSTRTDAAQASIRLAPASPAFAKGKVPVLELSEPYEGAGRLYAAWGSFGGPPGAALLGSGYTVPIDVDWFSEYTLFLPGFVGTLDSSGYASAAIPIPNVTEAIGVPIHFAMVVFSSGLPFLDEIVALADDTVFVIGP